MTQVDAAKQNQLAIKNYINGEAAMKKMQELMGKNAASFATSVMQIVNSNELLQKATPQSIFNAACMAATLNLPINNNLGFAYIVPFNNRKAGTTEAQFQLGYKGFIQLAQRSGQFKRINACAVYEQDTEEDVHKRLTSLIPAKPQGRVIGYIAYFQLLNGYEANLTMSMDELEAHAKQYSQTYKRGYGVWADNFEAMARKTVIKLLLSQQAPLSIEMQQAVLADQAVVKDVTAQEFEYIDNQPTPPEIAVTVDDTLFEALKENISTGQISKMEVLDGKYQLTEEQRAELAGM
ncbi:recombinase RecT [Neisseria sp. Dent CA1/247]|uniref:recombinase RecT n=1 Tax=Neisseria sp. Dent CA1/247 TaxID=2912675 RepID=UPI001FCFF5F2|nr:recombinase RecT [Neisseria sp. Dent CA1/247]UOO77965.1 recombinase RecT [Neisseria sp. Dent CA1/247]